MCISMTQQFLEKGLYMYKSVTAVLETVVGEDCTVVTNMSIVCSGTRGAPRHTQTDTKDIEAEWSEEKSCSSYV